MISFAISVIIGIFLLWVVLKVWRFFFPGNQEGQ